MTPELRAAGRRRYVSLTTFRRSGVGVATPVWIAPAGDALAVRTGVATGKVKRLRRDPRVEIRECSPTGKVRPGAPVAHGVAEVVRDPAAQSPLFAALRAKYGLLYRTGWPVLNRLERIPAPDLVLRITDG